MICVCKNCSDRVLFTLLEADPGFAIQIVIGDKTWSYQCDPETKCQSMPCTLPSSLQLKKARMSCPQIKSIADLLL